MAKLYAELTSDKSGRIASKGGDEEITTAFTNSNIRVFEVTFRDDGARRGVLEILNLKDASVKVVEY
jgi:hypothetical protein